MKKSILASVVLSLTIVTACSPTQVPKRDTALPAEATNVPSGWKEYKSNSANFAFALPPGWVLGAGDLDGEAAQFGGPAEKGLTFNVLVGLSEGYSLSQYLEQVDLSRSTAWEGSPSVDVLGSRDTTLDGQIAVLRKEFLTAAGFAALATYAIKNDTVYTFTMHFQGISSEQAALPAEDVALYEQILGTIVLGEK